MYVYVACVLECCGSVCCASQLSALSGSVCCAFQLSALSGSVCSASQLSALSGSVCCASQLSARRWEAQQMEPQHSGTQAT
jgi:hypothetical protein